MLATAVTDVDRLRALGFTVFPCKPDKSPRVRWQDPEPEGGWRFIPGDLIGVRLPEFTVVLDIDNIPTFKTTGLETPPTGQGTLTRREGGLHLFYLHGMADMPQGKGPGYDLRVGGKGYVIAWFPEKWVPAEQWGKAPRWMYDQPVAATSAVAPDETPMGTHDALIRWLGRIQAQYKHTAADLFGMMKARQELGLIVDLDPANPWTDADLNRLATDASKWDPVEQPVIIMPGKPAPPGVAIPDDLKGMNALDLMRMQLPPMQFAIPGLMPSGLGVVAAPPKAGKSFLCYQMAVELAFGGTILGRQAERRPVVYYALEDGRERSQRRLAPFLQRHSDPAAMANLTMEWTAPPLGGPLEKETDGWLAAHPRGVIIIDVLSKVRPAGKSGLNAYDEDYNLLEGLHRVAKSHPGSTILLVTHDRKAGSDDWMTRVTGTRGVTGAADFVIYVHRKREETVGTIYVSGRDVEDEGYRAEFMGDQGWRLADVATIVMETRGERRRELFQIIQAEGPISPAMISARLGRTTDGERASDRGILSRMSEAGEIRSVVGGYVVADDAEQS